MIFSAPVYLLSLAKRWCFIPLLFAFTSVSFAEPTKEMEGVKTPEEVEDRITNKITKNLNLFLGERDYRIFATAKIQNLREKIVLEGSTEAISTGEEKTGSTTVKLPGFTNNEVEKQKAKNINRNEKSRFTFRNRSTLTGVSVQLVLEKSLPQNAKDLAIKTTTEAIAMNIGDVGKLDVVELDLTPPSSPTTAWEWFAKYLSDRGGSAIDLLYLSLLLLGSLGTILALRHYFKSKKHAQSDVASAKISEGINQQKIDEQCSAKLDELIKKLNKHPLVTRNFLHNLKDEDKNFVYKSVKTPALQNVFRKVLMIAAAQRAEFHEKNSQETINSFEKILQDLKRFISLNEEMESCPFGYIPQLTGTQVAQFIAHEQDRVKALKIIAPFLTDHHLRDVTQLLDVSEKAAFIEGIRNSTGDIIPDSVQTSPETSDFRQKLDARMRQRFESIRREAVVDASEKLALEAAFLESDAESISVIKTLAARYGKVPSIYEKYLVGFEDFLGLDLGIAKKVLQRVSNEVLTQALADRDLDRKLVTLIGEMRSELLISMKKRDLKVSKQDIEAAKNEVLRQYRAMV